jgi:cellulose biosynthesis protein BcsQ
MISIAMFNNKGGVGKTTLTNNIASFISERRQKRVLVVDCDPQCNSTQLLMGEEYARELYWNGNSETSVTTISQILQPIEDGDSNINNKIVPIKSSQTRFNVDLIPGSPKLSIIEDRLGAAWHELKGGDIGGIRKTNWNTFLLSALKDNYDYIFYDLGPSLGSINRSVLIGCDCFLTPMGTDIFSILGIRNIAEWLDSWLSLYDNSLLLCEQRSSGSLEKFSIPKQVKIKYGYVGYTIQQYITKSYGGVRRPTKAYEEIINSVPDEIERSLGRFLKKNLAKEDLKLGDVPHLYSLIPLAQSNSSPLLKLKGSDGLVGSQFKQVQDYESILNEIINKLFSNLTK